jgi:hypothetical protein
MILFGKVKIEFPKHKTVKTVSWKLESRKSLHENKLLNSSYSILDKFIKSLMLQRCTDIINDLELSHRLLTLNNHSVPGDET